MAIDPEREREPTNPLLMFRFPLALEQLLVFVLAMHLELVTLRKLNGQLLQPLWSKVQCTCIARTNVVATAFNITRDILLFAGVIAIVMLIFFAGSRTVIAGVFTSEQ